MEAWSVPEKTALAPDVEAELTGSLQGETIGASLDIQLFKKVGNAAPQAVPETTAPIPLVIEPVSYTHLDVYKRQHEQYVSCGPFVLNNPHINPLYCSPAKILLNNASTLSAVFLASLSINISDMP